VLKTIPQFIFDELTVETIDNARNVPEIVFSWNIVVLGDEIR
jgi:hypothetical protein